MDSAQAAIYPSEKCWWDQTKSFNKVEFPWTVRADSVSPTPLLPLRALLPTKMKWTRSIYRSSVKLSPALLVQSWALTFPSNLLTSGLYLQVWAAITSGSGSTTGCLRGTSDGLMAARWWDTRPSVKQDYYLIIRPFPLHLCLLSSALCYYCHTTWGPQTWDLLHQHGAHKHRCISQTRLQSLLMRQTKTDDVLLLLHALSLRWFDSILRHLLWTSVTSMTHFPACDAAPVLQSCCCICFSDAMTHSHT